MKAYKTRYKHPFEIEEVEVIRFSNACVFLPSTSYRHKNGEERSAIVSDWTYYHKTREEAVAFVRGSLEANIIRAESALDYARRRLRDFNALEQPEGKAAR